MIQIDIAFILVFGPLWLFMIILSLKPMCSIYFKKPYLGEKLFEFKSIADYSWIILLPLFYFLVTGRSKKYARTPIEIYDLFSISLAVVFFGTFFYKSFQRNSLWTGGILDSAWGVFKWEEIISYSFAKEGPFQYEHLYSWNPNKYILTFNIIKVSKLGDKAISISWKVKEEFAERIESIVNDKLPQKKVSREEES